MIAMTEPDYARTQAQWLLFASVPFVDGPALERWNADHEERALKSALKAGVVC